MQSSNWRPERISQSSRHRTYIRATGSHTTHFVFSSVTMFLFRQIPALKSCPFPLVRAQIEARVLAVGRDSVGAGCGKGCSAMRQTVLTLLKSPPEHSLAWEYSFALCSGPVCSSFIEDSCVFPLLMLCTG